MPKSFTLNRLEVIGSDALDLLHRISTIHVQQLQLNQPQFTMILNPLGKIECAFTLNKIDPQNLFITLTDDENRTHEKKLRETLDHYTFAERYELKNIDSSVAMPSLISDEIRIEKMIPEYGHEYWADGKTQPLEINLRGAIHDQKGCYPGQEVIEKIISLGSPAKRLCQIKSLNDQSLNEVSTLYADADLKNEIGALTTFNGKRALAIIKKTHAKENQLIYSTTLSNPLTIVKVAP